MLGEREPVPDASLANFAVRVLAEVSQQVLLERRDVATGSEPHQPARQIVCRPALTSKRERRSETTNRVVPRVREQEIHQLEPARGPVVGAQRRPPSQRHARQMRPADRRAANSPTPTSAATPTPIATRLGPTGGGTYTRPCSSATAGWRTYRPRLGTTSSKHCAR